MRQMRYFSSSGLTDSDTICPPCNVIRDASDNSNNTICTARVDKFVARTTSSKAMGAAPNASRAVARSL